MKHLSILRKLLLMLCVMLWGANVWGETGTITFGNNSTKINSALVNADDNLGNSWTITTVGTTSFTANDAYYHVGSGKYPATSITFTATLPSEVNVTSFSAKFGGFSGTAGTINLKVGDTEVGSGSLNASNDVTVESSTAAVGNTLTVTVTGIAKGVKVYNISYTYEAAAGSGPAAPSFSLAAGTYYNAQTLQITTTVDNGTIYYTTDGTDPTTSNTRETYSSPLTISETTTIKACVKDSEGNFSDVVSRTYTIVLPQPATLPFSFDDGKSAISTTQGMDQTGLGSGYKSSPKLQFDDTGDELVIYYDGPASYLGYTIKGNGFSGGTFSVMESENGVNYTNVATYTTLAQVNTACMNALKSASRYVKFVYTVKKQGGGNVALGAIEISAYKAPVTVSAAGYATYYNSAKAYTLPTGCEGYVFYEGKLQNAYNAGEVVPANEPLVIKAEEDTYVLNFTTTGEKSLKSKGLNDLEGTDEETALLADEAYYFYGLSLNSTGDLNSVGFYWMNETGAAFTNGAHKAYLKLAKNNGAGNKAFVFGDEETAIKSIEAENATEAIYDLSGRRVSKALKGLYIINGKKVVK